MKGRKWRILFGGINDETHDVVGTNFNPNQNVNGEPLKHFLARQTFPDIDFRFDEITMENQRVVVLSIPKAKTILDYIQRMESIILWHNCYLIILISL